MISYACKIVGCSSLPAPWLRHAWKIEYYTDSNSNAIQLIFFESKSLLRRHYVQGRRYKGVWGCDTPTRTKNHEFTREIWDFQHPTRQTKHLSHRVFCVANVKATVAGERCCIICLDCQGEVNLCYCYLWGVSISVHEHTGPFRKSSGAPLFLFDTQGHVGSFLHK